MKVGSKLPQIYDFYLRIPGCAVSLFWRAFSHFRCFLGMKSGESFSVHFPSCHGSFGMLLVRDVCCHRAMHQLEWGSSEQPKSPENLSLQDISWKMLEAHTKLSSFLVTCYHKQSSLEPPWPVGIFTISIRNLSKVGGAFLRPIYPNIKFHLKCMIFFFKTKNTQNLEMVFFIFISIFPFHLPCP